MTNGKSKEKAKAKPTRSRKSTKPKSATGFPTQPVRRMPRVSPSQKLGLHQTICSITDPFCVHAKGAKYPDGKGGGTVTFQIRSLINWNTYVHGGNVFYIGGSLPFSYLAASSYAASAYTMNTVFANPGGNTGSFVSYADAYRIVSWGVIVRNALPALTAAGTLTVSKQTSMPPVSSVITAGQLVGSEVEVHPVNANLEVCVVGTPSGASSKAFTGQNTSTTETVNWQVIKLESMGTPADTATKFTIEVIYNLEFQLSEANSGLHQFITPSVPNKPAVLAASEKVLNSTSTIFADGVSRASSSILTKVEAAAEDILSSGLAWLGL